MSFILNITDIFYRIIRLKSYWILSVLFILSVSSCRINKHLSEDENLVSKNIIANKATGLEKADLEAFIRQKPNRKILQLFRFNLWLYNQVDQQKMIRKKEKRNARYDKINEKRIAKTDQKNKKRIAKGKKAKQPKLKNKDKLTFRESILEAGEAPVILDTFLTNITTKQLQRYVFSKGFFDSHVYDSVVIDQKNKRAKVYYFISESKPYLIRNVTYNFEDPLVDYFISNDTVNSLVKSGKRYDEEMLQSERTRITESQLNNGFYFFAPEYIYYMVDTNINGQFLDLTIGVKKYAEEYSESSDSLVYKNHPRFTINKIYLVPETVIGSVLNTDFPDTTYYNGLYFLHRTPLKFKQKELARAVSIYEGQLYQQSEAEATYKDLTSLRVFKSVAIQYTRTKGYSDKLDCYIVCQPQVKQALTLETEGTNTSGNLGLAGSLVYQNKNIFRGAELFEFKIKGAFAAQKQLNNVGTTTDIKNVKNTFNTFQFGPEMNIYFPRPLFPFTLFYYKKDANAKRYFSQPKTYLNMSLNYQSTQFYSRTISNIAYGFKFSNSKNVLNYEIIPFGTSFINATLTDTFKNTLINLKDYFLLNSFRNHVTTFTKLSVVFNDQNQTKKRNYTYLRINLTFSGNTLRGIYKATNQPTDTLGRYTIFNTPFSQFIKIDADWRRYFKIRTKSKLVFRVAGGIGKPLANLNVLPYEQSFFSGGPNSVRAWRARTLGPGSYKPNESDSRYDKIGDLQLESNIEYRFHIFKSFYGAWFLDAGNIWLLEPQSSKPNGDFQWNRFYKEIAMGSGFGLRWDFNFFILRLDAATRIYDPQYNIGDRWTFDKQPIKKTTILNFGIGYPF